MSYSSKKLESPAIEVVELEEHMLDLAVGGVSSPSLVELVRINDLCWVPNSVATCGTPSLK